MTEVKSWSWMRIFLPLCFMPGILAGNSSMAFHIDDHRMVTHQAFQEFVKCYPQASQLLDLEWLVSADVDEDLNLVQKLLVYSHYYNPYKKLQMMRKDSAGRITDLLPLFQRVKSDPASAEEMANLGAIVHHFQDMAVPAHVVPVEHSFWDGFESLKFTADISSGLSCSQLMVSQIADPMTILNETAEETLQTLKNTSFSLVQCPKGCETSPVQKTTVDGSAYWQESSDDGFGDYGQLENNFGSADFAIGDVEYQTVEAEALQFKQRQLRLAVRATLRALMWEMEPGILEAGGQCRSS